MIAIYFLRLLIFVCICVAMIVIYKEIYKKLDKKIEEAQLKRDRKKESIRRLEEYLYSNEKYLSYFQKLGKKIDKQGNPFNLTPVIYCFIKIAMAITLFILSSSSKNNFLLTIGLTVTGYFALDAIYYLSNKDDESKILVDLPDICDILDIQTAANVQLGLALTEVYDIPKSKRFRNALMELAAEINLTKKPETALDNFNKCFNVVELESFILSIKQALITGKSKEIIANNSEVLKENNIFNIQKKTRYLTQYLILIGLMLFIGACALIIFSFVNQVQFNLNNMMNN